MKTVDGEEKRGERIGVNGSAHHPRTSSSRGDPIPRASPNETQKARSTKTRYLPVVTR